MASRVLSQVSTGCALAVVKPPVVSCAVRSIPVAGILEAVAGEPRAAIDGGLTSCRSLTRRNRRFGNGADPGNLCTINPANSTTRWNRRSPTPKDRSVPANRSPWTVAPCRRPRCTCPATRSRTPRFPCSRSSAARRSMHPTSSTPNPIPWNSRNRSWSAYRRSNQGTVSPGPREQQGEGPVVSPAPLFLQVFATIHGHPQPSPPQLAGG
jgi:hypothetical protein